MISGLNPTPVSRTENTMSWPARPSCTTQRTTTDPTEVNFSAFDTRFIRICRTRATSPRTFGGIPSIMS